MKKATIILLVMISIFTFTLANDIDDNQVIDALQSETQEITKENIQLQKFDSCTDLEDIIKDTIKNNKHYYDNIYILEEIEENMEFTTDSADKSEPAAGGDMGGGGEPDYSDTNIQKQGVSEPDIIKTDGEYIFYYNGTQKAVYILQGPYNGNSININNSEILKKINLIDSFYNFNLFINNDKLYIISSSYNHTNKRNSIFDQTKTYVIAYDYSDITNLTLSKISIIDGSFVDARMIEDVIHVVTTSYLNLWDLDTEDVNISKKTNPKTLDLDFVSNGNYDIEVSSMDCDKMSFFKPNDSDFGMYNAGMTNITSIDTTKVKNSINTNSIFSNYAQLHVSKDNLYLISPYNTTSRYTCAMGDFCIMPFFEQGANSVIHKFNIDSNTVNYDKSNIVAGSALTQYSMDEDKDGNFRIITRGKWGEGTNVFILDKDMELKGKLTNIQPDEEFESSRYIGDKLYMVTFEQTDPLFVIDLQDIENPTIIGELHMPGYSTYLHPLSQAQEENGKQYLIGLGYDVVENKYGRMQNGGVKLSLYLVDYNQKETLQEKCGALALRSDTASKEAYANCEKTFNPENIYVKIVDEKILGTEGSYTEALHNPRLFVMDSDNNLSLPLRLMANIKEGTICETYTSINGEEIEKDCYDEYTNKESFVGIKTFSLDTTYGINEVFSKNYKDILSKNIEEKYYYMMENYMLETNPRVGYIGDNLYYINNYLADFIKVGGENKLLEF